MIWLSITYHVNFIRFDHGPLHEKKKSYKNLQSLIEVKKDLSVKCFAEYEVLSLSVTQSLRELRVCNGEDEKKELEFM